MHVVNPIVYRQPLAEPHKLQVMHVSCRVFGMSGGFATLCRGAGVWLPHILLSVYGLR